MACGFNCSNVDYNSTECNYWGLARLAQCGPNLTEQFQHEYNTAGCTTPNVINYERGLTAALIFVVSLIGNVCTIAILSKFKIHKIPDVLVIGLAVTDLVATFIPLPLSLYSYFAGYKFIHGDWLCNLYATVAQFTRYASVLIVTIVSVERYLAVIHPFFYRKHATPKKVAFILVICWLVALGLAIAPALDPCTAVLPHEGFCLFDIASDYAYSILVYGAVQYVIVLFCFLAVSVQLILVYRRRQKLKVQGKYNKQSNAQERQHEVKFVKPNLTSRISDLSKSLRKAAPAMAEKFQFGVEAQFAGMLFVVVALFYLSWTAMLVLILYAHIQKTGSGLEDALFWGIRLSVISAAFNPLVYGILARQYRLAYWYVIKLVFSKCCRCVSPPLKDVFASARAPGGDVRSGSTAAGNRRRRFRQNGSVDGHSLSESYWGRSTGAVLTGTTQTMVTHPNDLGVIEEADFDDFHPSDSIMEEHSTFIPSAGELASTVIIPHQVRDKNSDTDLLRSKNTLRATASLDNLGDGLLADFGCSQDPHPGVNNPMMNVLAEGESISPSSDENSALGNGFEVGRLYSNPVYQIELARRQRDSQTKVSSLVAASSAEDITLVSKAPLHPPPPPTSTLATITNAESTPQLQGDHTPSQSTPVLSHTPPTERDGKSTGGKAGNKRPVDWRLERMKRLQPKAVSRSQEFDVVAAEVDNRRSSLNFEPVSNGVHGLRMKFEVPTSDPPTPHISQSPATHIPQSPATHIPPPQANGKSGRCNSVGNSDSGRESMVLETDV